MEKIVVITGASGNLGSVAVRKFHESGFKVAAVSRSGTGETGNGIVWYKADLANEKEAAAVADQVQADLGSIDAAIMTAGRFDMGSFDETGKAELDRMFTINFETAYFISRRLLHHMIRQPEGGRMVFIGAKPAIEKGSGDKTLAYSFSKSLIFKLSEYINTAGSDRNVFSTVVVPGVIDSEANRIAMPQADHSGWVSPENIAETMLFICSDAAADMRDTVIKMYGKI